MKPIYQVLFAAALLVAVPAGMSAQTKKKPRKPKTTKVQPAQPAQPVLPVQDVIRTDWVEKESYSEGLAAVKDENGLWGYIDHSGNVAIPCTWKEAWIFEHDTARVKDDNDQWHEIDKTGKIIKDL